MRSRHRRHNEPPAQSGDERREARDRLKMAVSRTGIRLEDTHPNSGQGLDLAHIRLTLDDSDIVCRVFDNDLTQEPAAAIDYTIRFGQAPAEVIAAALLGIIENV